MDQQYMIPINMHTYFFNISKAHDNPSQASWEYLHDFLNTYNLANLSPDTIFNTLALQVRDNETAAMQYKWNKVKQSAAKVPKTCDHFCRRLLYCEITASEQFDFNVCLGSAQYDFINMPSQAIMNILTEEWMVDLTN